MKSDSVRKILPKLLVSTLLLWLIFKNVDLDETLVHLRNMDWRYAVFVPVFIVLNYVISSYRWKSLLVTPNSDLSLAYLTRLYFVGAFFNNFMPTSMGGDVYKMYQLGKKIGDGAIGFSATFMERFTGMIALVLISYGGLLKTLPFWLALLPDNVRSSVVLVFLFKFALFAGFWLGVLGAYIALHLLAKRISFVRKIRDALMVYAGHTGALRQAVFTSFLVQVFSILSQYFVFLALGIHVPFAYMAFVLPVITLAGFFIPSLNGLGVQDALYINFFSMVGVPQDLALSASIAYHFSRLLISLVGGVFYALGTTD